MGKSRTGNPSGKQKRVMNEIRQYLKKALIVDDEEAEEIFRTAHEMMHEYHFRDESVIDEIRQQREYKK